MDIYLINFHLTFLIFQMFAHLLTIMQNVIFVTDQSLQIDLLLNLFYLLLYNLKIGKNRIQNLFL